MKIVSRNQIDVKKWDRTVEDSSHFRHYYLSYYLDSCTPNWHAIVDDNYEFIWPLPVKLFPLKRVYQPLQIQQLGPVINEHFSNEKMNHALAMVKANFVSFNIKFNEFIKDIAFGEVTKHLNVEMSIPASLEDLRKGYNRNVISNLKKSEKSELKILQRDNEFQVVINAFKTSNRAKLKVLDDKYYKNVEDVFLSLKKRGQAECYLAEKNDKKIAGILLLKVLNRIMLFFSGSRPEARDCGAMHALIDHVLVQNVGQNMVMDFEGSDDDNLRFFYQSFGGVERVYLQSQYSKLPSPLNKLIK